MGVGCEGRRGLKGVDLVICTQVKGIGVALRLILGMLEGLGGGVEGLGCRV